MLQQSPHVGCLFAAHCRCLGQYAAFLSILLAGVTSGVLGLVISTALIVVFAEIVPQSICCRYGLVIGAKLALVIKFFMIVLAPISYPLAWILDKVCQSCSKFSLPWVHLVSIVN